MAACRLAVTLLLPTVRTCITSGLSEGDKNMHVTADSCRAQQL
jgi:hypothetical protein